MQAISKSEAVLMTAFAALLALAVFGTSLPQPAHYHEFADQRAWGRIPHAMDVLSNLAFAVAGVAGMCCLYAVPRHTLSNMQRAMAALFLAGLLLTAAASSWYHWQPDDAGLAVDRNGMAVAFAGLIGLAAAGRVSERAGAALGLAVLLLAPITISSWSSDGNVLPWTVLQFGAAALLAWLAFLRPRYWALDIRWMLVIAGYAAAKLLEMNDLEVYELTGRLVSGHTLKHLVAALSAAPVIAALFALRASRQNAIGAAITRNLSSRRRTGHA
jgi:hypothetical protein